MKFAGAIKPERPLAIFFAALFFSLAFAPSPLWFLAYFAVPLFIAALRRDKTFGRGFVSGYWFGLIVSIVTLYWVAVVTVTGFVAMVLAHPVYYAVLGGLYASARRKLGAWALALLPFIWVAMEYLRSLSEISFPWLNLSYTQWENLAIVQLASFAGDAAVSFFVVVVGLSLYLGYSNLRRPLGSIAWFVAAILIYSGGYFLGALQIQPVTTDLRVAVLQGNVANADKWRSGRIDHNFLNYEELTANAAAEGAKLVIWPETAAPCYLAQERAYLNWVEGISAKYGVDMLVGALYRSEDPGGEGVYSNSAYFFRPTGVELPPYNKQKLVPFSEHVPYSHSVAWLDSFRRLLRDQLGLDVSDFRPGDSLALYPSNGKVVAPLICFEVVYPDFVREMVVRGANLLAVITNDAWFGETAGPYQHAAIPVFRAVENRCWLIRAANTGISEIIDPNGHRVAAVALGERDYLVADVGGRTGETLFNIHGLWLSKICLVAMLPVLLIAVFGKRRDD
ncbi:MAG: apolipoprotein N-acyltransferase [bacterium]